MNHSKKIEVIIKILNQEQTSLNMTRKRKNKIFNKIKANLMINQKLKVFI
jgi:hypothetical protein